MSSTIQMKWTSALSTKEEVDAALAESLAEIQAKLGGEKPDVVFVFVSPEHRFSYKEVGEKIYNALQPRHMLGCSGGGVIGAGREAERTPALSITAALLPNVQVQTLRFEDKDLPDMDSGPRKWEDAAKVKAADNPHFIVLADPFSIRADDMLAGLDFAYPKSIKVGGLASGAHGPGQNALYLDGKVFREGAVGLALSGDVVVDTLVAQGCRPIGKPMSITQCHRNILVELDRRKPLEVLGEIYEQSNDRDKQLIRTSLYLGIVMDPFKQGQPGPGDFLIRNLVGMDAQRGVLAIGALLSEGQTVQFHLRDADAARGDLEAQLRTYCTGNLEAAKGEAVPPPPRGALLFSCSGRGIHLYGRPNHDSELFQQHLGDVPLAGFFCNGEIGPVAGTTHIHGFTSCFGIFRNK